MVVVGGCCIINAIEDLMSGFVADVAVIVIVFDSSSGPICRLDSMMDEPVEADMLHDTCWSASCGSTYACNRYELPLMSGSNSGYVITISLG